MSSLTGITTRESYPFLTIRKITKLSERSLANKSLVVEYADLIEELYKGGGGEKENVN